MISADRFEPTRRTSQWVNLIDPLDEHRPGLAIAGSCPSDASPWRDGSADASTSAFFRSPRTWLLLAQGVYSHLEKIILVLVIGFSISVIAAMVMLQSTDYRITGADIASGLRFSLGEPPAALGNDQGAAGAETERSSAGSVSASEHRVRWKQAAAVAVIALMGGLGVSGLELLLYPHWVREKGYHGFLGTPDSKGWADLAEGWLRLIKVGALVATVLVTVITSAFFLLGCAVLFRLGQKPEGIGVVIRSRQRLPRSTETGRAVCSCSGRCVPCFPPCWRLRRQTAVSIPTSFVA